MINVFPKHIKSKSGKDSNPEPSAPNLDALTTRPERPHYCVRQYCVCLSLCLCMCVGIYRQTYTFQTMGYTLINYREYFSLSITFAEHYD